MPPPTISLSLQENAPPITFKATKEPPLTPRVIFAFLKVVHLLTFSTCEAAYFLAVSSVFVLLSPAPTQLKLVDFGVFFVVYCTHLSLILKVYHWTFLLLVVGNVLDISTIGVVLARSIIGRLAEVSPSWGSITVM